MKKKVLKKIEPRVVNAIKRQYALRSGFDKYKLITVFSDYEIAIGHEQSLDGKMLELAVKK